MIVYKNVLVERKDIWLTTPDKVSVTLNFDHSGAPLGHAVLTKGANGIYADLYLNEGTNYGGLYPAIGFTAEKDMSTGNVTELSLCDQRNEDEGIPPLPKLSITVQRPKACKFCEHWNEQHNTFFGNSLDKPAELGYCKGNGAVIDSHLPDGRKDGFAAVCEGSGGWGDLITGPDFYCCHFKQKDGI